MIIGIGTDLVSIDRVAQILARHGTRFIHRVFAVEERVFAPGHPAAAAHYAKRWAAKEATAKALRTGIAGGLYLKDIVVVNDAAGAPSLVVRQEQQQAPNALHKNYRYHLSLSDDAGLALAFVVVERSLPLH